MGSSTVRRLLSTAVQVFLALFVWAQSAAGQPPTSSSPGTDTRSYGQATDYVVGPQDVLLITSYDQADLSGKFTVEADGTFTYPLIGRVKVGGMTLRAVETRLKKQLTDEGYFRNPQITVSIEQYKS